MQSHGFLAELKRRRVVRVALVYGAVAFAVLQGADLLAEGLALPGWVFSSITLLLIAGFPVALVLGWAFELTPEGVKRTDAASAEEVRAARASTTWISARTLAVAAALVMAGVVIGWFLTPRGAGNGGATPTIAVLPFTNLARSAETEPFVEGVHDDLLTQLSKIGALRVISRTSVQDYRDTRMNLRQIASELGVSHVVEGGVQRAGEQVRINVQLIDARSDEHLWAETYNRTLTVANIFEIQSEIAQAIAAALRARLSPEEKQRIAAGPTQSLEAYDHYQRGLAFFRRSQEPEEVRRAADAFEEAVGVDPSFADAWARLAIARSTLSWEWGRIAELPAAERAVRRAEELAPDRALSHLARAYYHYYGHREYEKALQALAKAEALAPEDAEIQVVKAWVFRRLGRFEEALEHFSKAFARDPRNLETMVTYAWTNVTVRRFDDAERLGRRIEAIAPEVEGAHHLLALLPILRSGDTAAAAHQLRRAAARVQPATVLLGWPPLSRILAAKYERELRAMTSADANDRASLVTQWQFRGLTPTAFFLQKAQALRALGDTSGARVHFDSARVVLEAQLRNLPGDVVWNYQGDLPSSLGVAYAGVGRKAEALRYGQMGAESLDRVGDPYMRPRIRVQVAEIYLVTGQADLAVEQLERASAETGLFAAPSLALDPLWSPLRSNQRFQRLIGNR